MLLSRTKQRAMQRALLLPKPRTGAAGLLLGCTCFSSMGVGL